MSLKNIFGTLSELSYPRRILDRVQGLGTGSSGFLRLYSDRFGGIKVPCPPLAEQKEIVTVIDRIATRFMIVENPIGVEIQKLREMRSTLIAAVVTGKLRA
ncbi:MAG: restriction endonuclease subunit S [Dechloromonas sp.]|nr:MAG: restriction endonuclease subunit S [Dechloromonas sp.]